MNRPPGTRFPHRDPPDYAVPLAPASRTATRPGTKDAGRHHAHAVTPPRRLVFVSYSHKDRRWVDRLIVHLKPLEHELSLDIWEDSRIQPGTDWRTEIEHALTRATAAILLISADFLASEFVMNEEVPALLRNAEANGTIIVPLIISPSLFKQSALRTYQSINPPSTPLSKLSTHKRDEILVQLAISVEQTLPRPAFRPATAD
jgi:TIR domain-containing protein